MGLDIGLKQINEKTEKKSDRQKIYKPGLLPKFRVKKFGPMEFNCIPTQI